jgi:hypothetical protein
MPLGGGLQRCGSFFNESGSLGDICSAFIREGKPISV